MKDYHEMAQSVLKRRDSYAAARRSRRKKITAALSCCCLCALLGVGAWRGILADVPASDTNTVGNTDQTENMNSIGTENGKESQMGHGTIVPGGVFIPEDSSGVPELEQSQPAILPPVENSSSEEPAITMDATPLAPAAADLTQKALYEAVGTFLPSEAPAGFSFAGATYSEYGYAALWSRGMEELHWRIRDYQDGDSQCLTRVADTQNYDLALYPIPRAQSVPEELRQIVDNPIFRAEELTQEAVNARAQWVNDAGDSGGCRMRFSVLYGKKVVSITSKGVSPEWIYSQLSGLSGTSDAPMQDEAGETGTLQSFDEIWGGSYMDAGGSWVVWLTEDTPENRAKVFERNPHISERGTKFKTADYSLDYLTRLLADISQAMGDGTLGFVSTAAVMEDINRVEVRMTEDTPELREKVLSFDTMGGAIEIRGGSAAGVQEILKKE